MGVRLFRTFEFALGAAGLLLLGTCAGTALDGFAQSQAAVEQFKSALPAPSAQVATASPAPQPARTQLIDFSRWSARRIAAFENSLGAGQSPPIAVLQIPKINLEVPVFRDTGELSLNRGVGWIAGTASPGGEGNIGIAGHRDGFFRGLRNLSLGDEIRLLTSDSIAIFRVNRIEIVAPEDTSVLSPAAGRSLTLVTCYPFHYLGSAPKRFVVKGTFISDSAAALSSAQSGSPIESNVQNSQGGKQQ